MKLSELHIYENVHFRVYFGTLPHSIISAFSRRSEGDLDLVNWRGSAYEYMPRFLDS